MVEKKGNLIIQLAIKKKSGAIHPPPEVLLTQKSDPGAKSWCRSGDILGDVEVCKTQVLNGS